MPVLSCSETTENLQGVDTAVSRRWKLSHGEKDSTVPVIRDAGRAYGQLTHIRLPRGPEQELLCEGVRLS